MASLIILAMKTDSGARPHWPAKKQVFTIKVGGIRREKLSRRLRGTGEALYHSLIILIDWTLVGSFLVNLIREMVKFVPLYV